MILLKGFCDVAGENFLYGGNKEKCMAQTLTQQDLASASIASNPSVPFSFIQVIPITNTTTPSRLPSEKAM
jgi:hypothetical protein